MRATTRANDGTELQLHDFSLNSRPKDFETWLERHRLATLAFQAVADVSYLIVAPEPVSASSSGIPSEKMMVLIIYCYATGVYDSAEIAASVSHDAILRDICAGTRPTADSIRRFRWSNTRALIRALSRVLRNATSAATF